MMLGRHNFELDPEEPLVGEPVQGVDIEGRPNGRWTKVKILNASDVKAGKFEVLDNENRTIIVCWNEDHWLECEVD